MTVRTEDLSEIERASRRCSACRSGRGWRRFEVVRFADRQPVVLCGNCRTRFGDDPPVGHDPVPASEHAAVAARPHSPSKPAVSDAPTEPPRDRLRVAIGEMPGSFSTAMAARAAGLNNARTLVRLRDLEHRGEIRRVGKRWSTESPPSELAAAMDRLEARTSNLRIVR
jgi:hypothetical protein